MQDTQKVFNPYDMVDFNLDYFAILGLSRENFPQGKTKLEKKEIADILEKNWKSAARQTHPDMPGGSAEKFKLVIRANTVLSDPYLRNFYLTNGAYRPSMAEQSHQEIDWSQFGEYRTDSLASSLGTILFLQIAKKKEQLNLIPAFIPKTEFDHYIWDFVLKQENNEQQQKLSLSLVHDEEDVLRLTSGENVENSLPFKIYICIPRAYLYMLKGKEEKFIYPDGSCDTLIGKLQAATYSDFNLFESTSLESAREYIDIKLKQDLEDFRSGKLSEMQQGKDIEAEQNTALITGKEMKEMDKDLLKALLRMKTFVGEHDPNADKFLERLPTKKNKI